MKRLLLIPLFFVTIQAKDAVPAEKEEKIPYINEMSLLVGDSENGFDTNMNRSIAYQLQFQYNGLDFPIRPEIAFVHSQSIDLYSTGESTKYSAMMFNGVYEVPYTDNLTPYIKAGLGYASYSDQPGTPDSAAFLDAGVGAKLNLSDRWSLKFEALAGIASSHVNILATGGISFRFGRKYVAPPPEKVCEPCEEINVVVPKTVYITKQKEELFGASTIQFEYAKANLTDESKASMVEYAKQLNNSENINYNIIIIGNTDNKGSRAFNATLSIKRANAVRAELIKNDVDPQRITIEGLGEINPIADNNTITGRDKNRRVIILLKEQEH
jgi:outer membrane protein OmpA-like peptidoglycan-associated protein